MSRHSGWNDEQVAAIRAGEHHPSFSEAENFLLDYATQMSGTPAEVDDELFENLRRHFSDEQIIELSAFIAYENFRARLNHALGIGSDALYCPLPSKTETVPSHHG